MAVIRIALQRLGGEDKTLLIGHRQRDFRAELVRPMRLALGDAHHLGHMQAEEFALARALLHQQKECSLLAFGSRAAGAATPITASIVSIRPNLSISASGAQPNSWFQGFDLSRGVSGLPGYGSKKKTPRPSTVLGLSQGVPAGEGNPHLVELIRNAPGERTLTRQGKQLVSAWTPGHILPALLPERQWTCLCKTREEPHSRGYSALASSQRLRRSATQSQKCCAQHSD